MPDIIMNADYITDLLHTEKTHHHTSQRLTEGQLEAAAIIEDHSLQEKLLKELMKNYMILQQKVDTLLKNTLPAVVAEEIKYGDRFAPRVYDCTILFSDFVGFTRMAERLSNTELIDILNRLFCAFDDIVSRYRGTKIKTVGDAYMIVFGAPTSLDRHAYFAVLTALEMQKHIDDFNRTVTYPFQMRVGIHSGRVIAGVVGKERLQFDVFGDNVNIASRFESAGEPGQVNISEETYRRTKEYFHFIKRGKVPLKNKDAMNAYFVRGTR